jgi:NifU-like protein
MVVDESTNTIIDARFKTFGCGTAIASSDVMTEMCIGKTVDEALTITNIDVEQALRDETDKAAIPPQKMHCSVMAYDVIKKAASVYKDVNVAELEDEEIVCECARVTLGTIKDVIRLNDLTSVEEITRYTKAGAFCKSCVRPGGHEKRSYYLVDILNQTRAEMEEEKTGAGSFGIIKRKTGPNETELKTVSESEFSSLSLIQKYKALENILDEHVRPLLIKDGGDVEVIDMKELDDRIEVYISYRGACRGCSSAKTGTLGFIEGKLQEQLESSIKVTLQ